MVTSCHSLGYSVYVGVCIIIHVHSVAQLVWSVVSSNPSRGGSFFFGKVTALGVLCCFALFV